MRCRLSLPEVRHRGQKSVSRVGAQRPAARPGLCHSVPSLISTYCSKHAPVPLSSSPPCPHLQRQRWMALSSASANGRRSGLIHSPLSQQKPHTSPEVSSRTRLSLSPSSPSSLDRYSPLESSYLLQMGWERAGGQLTNWVSSWLYGPRSTGASLP